jgi:hypothetical protein
MTPDLTDPKRLPNRVDKQTWPRTPSFLADTANPRFSEFLKVFFKRFFFTFFFNFFPENFQIFDVKFIKFPEI